MLVPLANHEIRFRVAALVAASTLQQEIPAMCSLQ